MSAKEMFEELGYKLIQDDMNWLRYGINISEWYEFDIEFNKNNKNITFSGRKPSNGRMVDLDELKAINKQIEELGWLE